MSFCSNCGANINEDDIFCGSCGFNVKSDAATSQESTNTNNGIKKDSISIPKVPILRDLFSILVRPVSTIENIIKEINQKTIIIISIVFAILQGLFLMWSVQQSFSMLDKKVIEFMKQLSNLDNIFNGLNNNSIDSQSLTFAMGKIDQMKQLIHIPYGSIFIHGAILFAIVVGILFIGIYAISNLIFKIDSGSLTLFKIITLSTVPFLGGELICILLSYISSTLGLVILLLGLLISFSTLLVCIKDSLSLSVDKLIFIISITSIIMAACFAFVSWRFILSDANSIKNSFVGAFSNIFQ